VITTFLADAPDLGAASRRSGRRAASHASASLRHWGCCRHRLRHLPARAAGGRAGLGSGIVAAPGLSSRVRGRKPSPPGAGPRRRCARARVPAAVPSISACAAPADLCSAWHPALRRVAAVGITCRSSSRGMAARGSRAGDALDGRPATAIVLRHELAHIARHARPTARRVPRAFNWFNRGLAPPARPSRERVRGDVSPARRGAGLRERLPWRARLAAPTPSAICQAPSMARRSSLKGE
jgi:hypothetical protein